MVAYMNFEAFELTCKTGFMHYYSRSRDTLWKKGETSGHVQKVISASIDCDRDTLLYKIDQTGAACHTGNRSCFYTPLKDWDYENDLVVDKDVVGVMWTVGANIVIPTSKCPTIYLSNKSNVHIVGEGFNTANIKLFDESKVTIDDIDKDSEVIVYKYSDKATVEEGKYCFGKVKVFNKELRL
jgi:hypothetical protein